VSATAPASLAELQAHLVELFTREAPIDGDPAVAPLARAIAAGNDRVRPEEQLDIYRRQVWLRHRDSLEEDLPGLVHVLGDDGFEAFARAYLRACPPHHPSLRELPFDALAFTAGWDGFPAGKAALARAMIAYELALVDVFDQPEPAPLAAEKVAAVPPEAWETARLVLSPAVRRVDVDYPVHRIRYAVRSGESPELPDQPSRIHLLVFRQADVCRYEELELDAARLVDILARGVALVPACAELTAGRPEDEVARVGASVGGWFKRLAELGVMADVVVGGAA
jgi:hypothetical protein